MKSLLRCLVLAMICVAVLSTGSLCAGYKLTSYDFLQLAELKQRGLEALTVLGPQWELDAEHVDSVPGWKYRHAICLIFSNSRMVFGGEPAEFRVVITNMSRPEVMEDSSTDAYIPFGVGEYGYWYCSTDPFRTGFPEQWEETRGKLREFFELQKEYYGHFYRLQGGSKIIPIGEPVAIQAGQETFYGKIKSEDKLPSSWPEHLVITGPSGKRLPLKTPEETEAYDNQRKKIPDVRFINIWGQDIARFYDMTQPGIYKIRLKCPLQNNPERVVESQQTTVRIVSTDFLKPVLKRQFAGNARSIGSDIPVKLETELKEGDLNQFSEFSVSYSASVNSKIHRPPHIPEFYGSSTNRMSRSIKGDLERVDGRLYSFDFDLAKGLWNKSVSSIGPEHSIWKFAKPGENMYLWVTITAVADRRTLTLTSNVLQIPVVK